MALAVHKFDEYFCIIFFNWPRCSPTVTLAGHSFRMASLFTIRLHVKFKRRFMSNELRNFLALSYDELEDEIS